MKSDRTAGAEPAEAIPATSAAAEDTEELKGRGGAFLVFVSEDMTFVGSPGTGFGGGKGLAAVGTSGFVGDSEFLSPFIEEEEGWMPLSMPVPAKDPVWRRPLVATATTGGSTSSLRTDLADLGGS